MASIPELMNSFHVDSKKLESLLYKLMDNNTGMSFYSEEANTMRNSILSEHGLWMISKLTQTLKNADSTKQLLWACKIIGFLIGHCKQIPEIHKQISMQHVKQLINIQSTLRIEQCVATYYLIAVLLYHYPEVCERFQEIISKIIFLHIDSTDENSIHASSKCFVLLSRATERSFKVPESIEKSMYTRWTYNEALLCNSLHAIMDELFSGLIELEKYDISDKLELQPISEENVIEYYGKQKQRFSNLCIYLSSMLRGYDARNSVLPHDILGVLCRGLAITPLNLKNVTSAKKVMLSEILPNIHISLLTVLDAFINGFVQESISLGMTILQLLQQTLKWTSAILQSEAFMTHRKQSFRNVKIFTYKCLSSWLMNTSCLSGIETIANECVAFILKDIIPERDLILLTQQSTKNLSKRAIKRHKDNQYENSPILNSRETSTKSKFLDADLCKAALVVLQNILSSGSIMLKLTFYKNVQNSVIPLLYNIYLDSSEQNFYKDHNECRLELFKVLKALQMNPHIMLAFPAQYYLEISRMAAFDSDSRIAQKAKLAIAELEKIFHPFGPTLQLPRQQEPDDIFVFESLAEEIAIIKSDKRNRVEEEYPQYVDVISTSSKRPKITAIERVKIVQSTSHIEQSTELTKTTNSVRDVNKYQAKENSFDDIQEEIGNVVQEQDKIHCNKEQSQPNIDKITNAITENTIERELSIHINTEKQEQNEQFKDLVSCPNETNKIIEKTKITEEAQEVVSQNVPKKCQDISEKCEEIDADILDSLRYFHDEVKSND